MKVLLAGASGLLGQALRRALIANGDAVHVLVRREPRDGVETEWHPERSELDPVCAARRGRGGLPVRSQPWPSTVVRPGQARHRREPGPAGSHPRPGAGRNTRTGRRYTSPRSGAGSYGDTGSRVIDESAPYGNTFLAGVCRLWEGAADPAASSGVRVVHLRSGPVLAAGGDLMKRLKPIIWLGLGGRLGSGEQFLPVDLARRPRRRDAFPADGRCVRPGERDRSGAGPQRRGHRHHGSPDAPPGGAAGACLRHRGGAGRYGRGDPDRPASDSETTARGRLRLPAPDPGGGVARRADQQSHPGSWPAMRYWPRTRASSIRSPVGPAPAA